MKAKVLIPIGIVISIIAIFAMKNIYLKKSYELIHPKKGEVLEAIYGLGKVVSDETFEVKVGVVTSVEDLYVKEGDQVSRKQKLIELDGQRIFHAPFSGTITKINYEKGEVITPQSVVLKLENLSKLYVEVSLEQNAALRVKAGMKTNITFESQSQRKYEGIVRHIYPRDGEFITRVEVQGLSAGILPGMTADVVIVVGKKENVLLVPIKSVIDGKVSISHEGKKKKVKVETGNSDGMWVEVKEGDIHLDDQIMMKK